MHCLDELLGNSGLWYAGNKNLHINTNSGIAAAAGVGATWVTYDLTSDISTYTEVCNHGNHINSGIAAVAGVGPTWVTYDLTSGQFWG